MEMNEKKVSRMGSLMSADPQEQLLKCFLRKNFDRFRLLLNTERDLDINKKYDDPEGRLIELSCMREGYHDFLQELLDHGANPNFVNKLRKKAPIHLAIERDDPKSVDKLLKCKELNVNIQDSYGDSPLHYAVKLDKVNSNVKDTTILQKLLEHPDINMNIPNRKGQTAIHLAANLGNEDAVWILLKDSNLDMSKDPAGKTAREVIEQKFNISLPMDGVTEADPLPYHVFQLIRIGDFGKLSHILSQDKELADSDNGHVTALQHVCDRGIYSAVKILVDSGADVNRTSSSNSRTPIALAARKGFYEIVEYLMKTDEIKYDLVENDSLLHCVINGSVDFESLGKERFQDTQKDHIRCLELILSLCQVGKLNINQGDVKGNTALHCAGKIRNEQMVLKLLNAGAYVGENNAFNDPAIAAINPSTFEKYLDSSVTINDKLPREEDYGIDINYKCFAPTKILKTSSANDGSNTLSETDLLLYIAKSPDLRFLLRHPVISSLVFLKWSKIKKWFIMNLFFYILFSLLLTIYILGAYDNSVNNDTNGSNITKPNMDHPENGPEINFLWVLVILFLGVLIIRELFQFFNSVKHYVLNLENWLEVALIMTSLFILFCDVNPDTKRQLAAAGILLSWTDSLLLVGKLPSLSTNIEMLKTVSWNFSKFLALYSVLIIAFALSFYTLFKDAKVEDNAFVGPGVSIFKTVVMLTGEFEAGDIPFVEFPVTSHILFMLFVFSIAIVLYNLLNGLAVNDTQAIRADAEMVSYEYRIKLISYAETIDPSSIKRLILYFSSENSSAKESQQYFWQKSLFVDMVSPEIRIYPNNGHRIEYSTVSSKLKPNRENSSRECCWFEPCLCNNIVMDSSIVKAAFQLIDSKNCLQTDRLLEEYKKTLDDYKNLLLEMQKRLK